MMRDDDSIVILAYIMAYTASTNLPFVPQFSFTPSPSAQVQTLDVRLLPTRHSLPPLRPLGDAHPLMLTPNKRLAFRLGQLPLGTENAQFQDHHARVIGGFGFGLDGVAACAAEVAFHGVAAMQVSDEGRL